MSNKISVHVDLTKTDKELDEIVYKCSLDNIANKAANRNSRQNIGA